MRTAVLTLICLSGFFVVSAACAEGCEEGTQRAPNAKEKAYYSTDFKVLRSVVPKPPAGWQYGNADKDKLAPSYDATPSYLCGDTQSYYIGLGVGYQRPMTQADSDKEMQALQAKPDPAKQKELDGLMAQQQALILKSVAAAQKQDTKTLGTLGKQSDALNAKISQVEKEMNAGPAAAMAAVQHDRDASVRIAINDASDTTCYGDPKPIHVPGAIAYQCENPPTFSSPGNQLDPPKGRIVVVFGKGAQVETGDWGRQDAQGQEHQDSFVNIKYTVQETSNPAVQFVTVDVAGDDLDRAMSLYKQMNLAPLAALIKK